MKKTVLVLAVLASSNIYAWDCKYEREIVETIDLDNSELLTVLAGAGDLRVTGFSGSGEAVATGKVCASKEEWLDESSIEVKRGKEAMFAVSTPDVDNGWSISGNKYAYIDLYVEVPDTIALEIRDSSGDMDVESTGPVVINDSSGDIDVQDIKGDVVLNDSSGDIDIVDVLGSVIVEQDSSGDLYGEDIEGSVLVERDSSGDIRFQDVRDDFIVERDSSGDIVARTIGGDFQVRRDGSGEISHRGVSGDVDIPEDKS